jgi:hypothetical protein
MAQANSVPTPISRPITGATLKASTKDARRHWSKLITGGLPVGTYVVTAFYATAVILVSCARWNFLLILNLLLSRARFYSSGSPLERGRPHDR